MAIARTGCVKLLLLKLSSVLMNFIKTLLDSLVCVDESEKTLLFLERSRGINDKFNF